MIGVKYVNFDEVLDKLQLFNSSNKNKNQKLTRIF